MSTLRCAPRVHLHFFASHSHLDLAPDLGFAVVHGTAGIRMESDPDGLFPKPAEPQDHSRLSCYGSLGRAQLAHEPNDHRPI